MVTEIIFPFFTGGVWVYVFKRNMRTTNESFCLEGNMI